MLNKLIKFSLIFCLSTSCNNKKKVKTDYYLNGNISSRITYEDTIKNGLGETFFRNGKLKERFFYKDGELSDKYVKYDSFGNLVRRSFLYNGKELGPVYVFSNGKLILYNEDEYGGAYYVKKYDSIGEHLIKEEGVCFSPIIHADTLNKQILFMLYAEPDGYTNDLKIAINDKLIPVLKNEGHKIEIQLPENPGTSVLLIKSVLKNEKGIVVCQDSLTKHFP